MVAADDPDRAVLAEHAPRLGQPLAGEGVVGGQVLEPVPGLVHAVHQGIVGPAQVALQLKVIGRVGEDRVHGGRRQPAHLRHAVPDQDLVKGQIEPRSQEMMAP